MLSPVKILRKTIVNALINRKTTINCEVLRKTSVPCSLDMVHILFPAFVSAEVGIINENTWVITFDRDLDNIIPLVAENAFISAGFTFNSISKTGAKEIRLISDQDVSYGQVLTLQYNRLLTLNPLQGLNSLKVPSFIKSVTNNVPLSPVFVSAEVGLIDAYTIDMLFDLTLNEAKIPDAADLIALFSGSVTYDDWFLPSRYELLAMYNELHLYGIGGFNTGTSLESAYWSSSETNATNAMAVYMRNGAAGGELKILYKRVRACRSFTSTVNYELRDVGPAGGWIFWKSGNDYLECAPSDQSASSRWSNISLLAGTSYNVGTGQANTTLIINQVGHTESAAKVCNDASIVSSTVSVISILISGLHVYATLNRAITAGETGTIQYIPNADEDKQLQGTNGAKVAAFTESVTNNVTAAFSPDDFADINLWTKSRSELELVDEYGSNPSIQLPYLYRVDTGRYAYINDNGALDVGSADFTLAFWSKSETTNKSANRLLAGKSVSGGVNGRYGIYALATTGYIYVAIQTSTTTYEITSNIDYTSLDWHTIRLDVNQTTKKIRLFVSNVQVGSDLSFLGTFAALNNIYRFYIGAQNLIGSGNPTIGSISSHSDMIVLNRLLTTQEALDFEQKTYPTNCKAHWPCNTYIMNDVSGNNYHLTSANLSISNVKYGVNGSRHLLNYGYKIYTKSGSPNFYVPYLITGTPIATPNVPAGYESFINYNHAGHLTDHNGADSMIVMNLATWDRSNTTIYAATARLGYYLSGTPKAWHPTELWQLAMKAFFNTGYEGINFVQHSLTTDDILEIVSYDANKISTDFRNIIIYTNNYDSYHTIDYIFQSTHICTQRGAKILTNAANVLYLSLDGGASNSSSIAQIGIITRAKIYENGNIMWCTQTQAFYSTDNLATKQTATVLDVNGDPFVPETSSNFTPLHEHNIDDAGSMAIPDLFGMYSVIAGQEYDNVNVWCTTDYGVTIKSVYKFGTSLPVLASRHFHNINYNRVDDSWYICTGDGNVDPDARIMKFVHDSGTDLWTWEQLANGLLTSRYITLGAAFKDTYFYWGNDYQDVYRVPYADLLDTTQHEKILLTGDGTSVYLDDLIIISYLSNTGTTIYTSGDRGRTWLSSTLTGGPATSGGGYTCCINKNSNGYYRMEIIESTETLDAYTLGTVLLIKINKL